METLFKKPSDASGGAGRGDLFRRGFGGPGPGAGGKGLDQLETALRRGCVSCYATEGVYPPTLEYLQEHYGVQIDRRRYKVYYEVFAENLMPSITVLAVK